MPFEKGRQKTGGKQKGTQNKTTTEIKLAVKDAIESNLDNIQIWLQQVGEKNPDRALGILLDMMEFAIPKLSRVENKHEGEMKLNITPIEFVKNK